MSNPSQEIVLVEDEHHEMLTYKFLTLSDLKRHDLRIPPYPGGRGSAEAWVRKRFAAETAQYRNRQTRAETALIVMIDADTHTVDERLSQLDQALGTREKSPSRRTSESRASFQSATSRHGFIVSVVNRAWSKTKTIRRRSVTGISLFPWQGKCCGSGLTPRPIRPRIALVLCEGESKS